MCCAGRCWASFPVLRARGRASSVCCSFVALTHTAECPAFGLSNNLCPAGCAPAPAARNPSAPGSHPFPHSAPEVTGAIGGKGRAAQNDDGAATGCQGKTCPPTHNARPHPLPPAHPLPPRATLRRRDRTPFPIPHQRLRARSAEKGALPKTTTAPPRVVRAKPAHPLTTPPHPPAVRTPSPGSHPLPHSAPEVTGAIGGKGALPKTTTAPPRVVRAKPAHPLTTHDRTRSRRAHPSRRDRTPSPFRTRGYGRDRRKRARGSAPWPEIIATLFPGITSQKPAPGPQMSGSRSRAAQGAT